MYHVQSCDCGKVIKITIPDRTIVKTTNYSIVLIKIDNSKRIVTAVDIFKVGI